MTLPRSFAASGFGPLKRPRRVLIGSDGLSDSGKSEFACSAPGPGIVLCLDRGIEAMLDNPNPPPTRNEFAYKIIEVPKPTMIKAEGGSAYLPYWRSFYGAFIAALDNPDCRTVVIDGDSDSWELQRMAEFGKLTKIPSIMYTAVNTARRAMYARAHDSGKNIIATNKVKKEYADVVDAATGKPISSESGNAIREWTGEYERQGFGDQDYLWMIQITHLFENPVLMPNARGYGLRITKCKANQDLIGTELWNADCNFATLVQLVYPQYSLEEWGL